jgi:hypothetical protein
MKNIETFGAGYMIRIPEIQFDPKLVPRHKLAEMAKIFYSGAQGKAKRRIRTNGPEAISSIIPRVMAEMVKVAEQRTN